MGFSKERLDEMDNYNDIRDELLTKEEQAAIDQEVEAELVLMKDMKIAKRLILTLQEQKGEDAIGVLVYHGLLRHFKEDELLAFAKRLEQY